MKVMTRLIFATLIFALASVMAPAKAFAAPDPGIPDTVFIPVTFPLAAGGTFNMPVNVYNDENCSGATLGFTWTSSDVVVDTVYFTGGRVAGAEIQQYKIDNVNRQVLLGFAVIFSPPLTPGTGLLATIRFRALPGAANQCVTIDTTFVPPAGKYTFIAQAGNVGFIPQFKNTCNIVVGSGCPANQAPILTAIGNKNVNEGQLLSFGVSASDPDGNSLTLSASPLPSGAIFTDNGNGTGTFNWTPSLSQSGSYPLTFTASDGSLSDEEAITIAVANVNQPPVLAAIGGKSVNEGQNLAFIISATDADGNPLTFTAPGTPPGAVFTDLGNGTASFNWTPTFDQSGLYPITFTVSDGSASDFELVQITVNPVNRAPVLANIIAQSVNEGQLLTFGASASDPDGQIPFLSATNLPPGASFDDNLDGTGAFSWTPGLNQAGDYNVTITASDGSLTDDQIVTITVINVNQPPVLAAVGNKSVNELALLQFTVSGSDPDGSAVSLSASSPLPTGANFVDNGNGTGDFTWTPADGQDGDHGVTFTVSDGSLTDAETITITVNNVTPGNTAPVLTAIGDKSVNENALLSFGVSATDNEGDPLTLSVSGAPSGSTFIDNGNGTGTFGWTPGFGDAGVHMVTFSVSDGSLNDEEMVHITVTDVNRSPAFAVNPNNTAQIIDEGQGLAAVTANDPDGDGLSFSINSGVLPPGILLNSNGSFSGTASFSSAGNYLLDILVSDGKGGTDVTTLAITVNNVNRAPVLSAIGNKSVQAGALLNFGVTASDPDGDPLTFSTSALPSGASFDADLHVFDWTPSGAQIGDHPVSFSVTDGSLSDNEAISISVTEQPTFTMNVTPDTLYFTVDSGSGFSGYTHAVLVTSTNAPASFTTALTSNPFSSVSPGFGSTPDSVAVGVNPSDRQPGVYEDTITFSVAGVTNSPQALIVRMQVNHVGTPGSVLALSQNEFHFVCQEGDTCVLGDSLVIYNIGDGPQFPWLITPNGCYIYVEPGGGGSGAAGVASTEFVTIAPLSGVTPGVAFISVDGSGLTAGRYCCEFTVAGEDAASSPQYFLVCLAVLPDTTPPPSGDTLWVSTVPATPGSMVKVPVNLINQGPVCELSYTLAWGSSDIYLDSISFAGTRLEGLNKTETTINNLARTANLDFNAIDFALSAGVGRVAYLCFTVFSGLADAGFVPIDLAANTAIHENNCESNVTPTFFEGGVVIDSSFNFICGRVIDPHGNEIPGATVQVWDNFPGGSVFAETLTDDIGSFKFDQLYVVPYTLYAFADGYYPNWIEDINFGTLGIEIVLSPVPPVQPTNEWVSFYCDQNLYQGVPLPVGSVIDAYDPDGDHVGSWMVTEAGKYGFMPVYRDDFTTEEDDGADPGDVISFYINGQPVSADGPRVWTQNGERFQVCLDYSQTNQRVCCLKPGWNSISWNVNTVIDDITAIFGPIMDQIDVILSFEEVGLTYDPALPDFSTLLSADHLHGYWVKVLSEDSCLELVVEGLPVLVNQPNKVEQGWNFVSYLPSVELPTPSALVSQEGNLRIALGYDGGALTYDPALPEFSTLQTLKPCFGYWLKVYNTSMLVYPGFGAPGIELAPQSEAGVLAKLGVQDELVPTPSWMSIYSSDLRLDGHSVSAGTEIRALNKDGLLIGFASTGAAGKLMLAPVYGAIASDDRGLRDGETFTLEVNGVPTNEVFTWAGDGARQEVTALTAKESGSTLPSEFALSQNYPNPFNPSTKIAFSVPSAGHVTLEVYNVLGARVTTLVDGNVAAGETVIEWNGRDSDGNAVASGVYFYTLKQGAKIETKKMALMK